MLLSVCSFAQQIPAKDKSQESATYVKNELIIWLEQGVDASTFAVNCNVGITPKRLLSKRLNIWLFEIANDKEPREEKMHRLTYNPDVKVVQNNHTNIIMRESIPNDTYYDLQWAPAVMSLPQAWEEFTTGGVTATGDTIVGGADWTPRRLELLDQQPRNPLQRH